MKADPGWRGPLAMDANPDSLNARANLEARGEPPSQGQSGTPDPLDASPTPLGAPQSGGAPTEGPPSAVVRLRCLASGAAMAGVRLARRLVPRLPRLVARAALGFAVVSVLAIGTLRWVDPPTSAFMVLHTINGWRLGRTQPYVHHRWVPWDEIPRVLPLAAIAAEDQRFALHHGFDPVEIRKALDGWRAGRPLRGASTITQQTAKNLFLWPGRNWLRKGLEAWLAALIEALWPKQRILEVYLNIVQFSPSTYGVGAASERYFHRPVSELALREAVLMAAVLPAPSAYRLDKPSARLRRRADWIADQTRRLGGLGYLRKL